MRYFKGIKTEAGATKRWKALSKKHHPDVGGDPEIMTAINSEYRELLIRLRTPPAPEPVICEPYVPQERPETAKANMDAPSLIELLSDDEKGEVVQSLADTAGRVVKATVTAALRSFFRTPGSR